MEAFYPIVCGLKPPAGTSSDHIIVGSPQQVHYELEALHQDLALASASNIGVRQTAYIQSSHDNCCTLPGVRAF
eukprot:scaffold306848_cov36-Prasinocladus_malaysianus.AAC.2